MQPMLNLFECCSLHDNSHCNVDCLHGGADDACSGKACQRIVCCNGCPYYTYKKQTAEEYRSERIFLAELFGCTPKEVGLRV